MDVFGFADFPYINGAQKYVEGLDFKLEELFYDRAFEQIRLLGKERVLSAINDSMIHHESSDRVSAEKELLSYPVARILVSCVKDSYLIKRYALSEAKSSKVSLEKLSDDGLVDIASEFNISSRVDERSYVMHCTDFIRYAGAIHEHRWKLINQKMNRGWVYLPKEKFLRIIEEAVRKRIESALPLDVPPGICAALEGYIIEIKNNLSTMKSRFSIEEFKEIMPDSFPPCMKHALSGVKTGVNLPHSMRFALTSFLLNIGMNTDGIMEMFRGSPDFDAERTRYQVMHIHGSTGTAYTSPSCATMTTYGNCFGKEALCERISHPLSYYRKRSWMLKKGR